MLKTLQKLYRIKLLTPAGLYHLASAIFQSGINLMALLRFAAKLHPENIALVDEQEKLTYGDLLTQTEQLTIILRDTYHVTAGKKIAVICRNHAALIKSIFSVSYAGADMYLLNAEMSSSQFNALIKQHCFDLIIYDAEVSALINQSALNHKAIPAYSPDLPCINSLSKSKTAPGKKIKRSHSGKIIVLTGGTTGDFKTAERKPSVINFLDPFFHILVKLNLNDYKSVYIATPVYHGFGIASVFMSMISGMKMFLLPIFDKQKACELIQQHNIEAVTIVPLMLYRILSHDPVALRSLNCIISGGAALDVKLVEETHNKLGPVLFNLYGTSEAGVCIMATPADLKYAPNTIGKAIAGATIRLLDADNKEVTDGLIGRICVNSKWAVKNNDINWIETGDLGYRDKAGYYYLCGKMDDRIVSGGENVYPAELENILMKHRDIKHAAVIGISDDEFGQRLKAFIVPADNSNLHKKEIHHWLSTRAARFQMPKHIEFLEELPYTALGKPDKKGLR